MTATEKKNTRVLLNFLHGRDRKPIEQEELFGELNAKTGLSRAEALDLVKMCDEQGWLTGVQGRFTGALWAINDEGEIARLQL